MTRTTITPKQYQAMLAAAGGNPKKVSPTHLAAVLAGTPATIGPPPTARWYSRWWTRAKLGVALLTGSVVTLVATGSTPPGAASRPAPAALFWSCLLLGSYLLLRSVGQTIGAAAVHRRRAEWRALWHCLVALAILLVAALAALVAA